MDTQAQTSHHKKRILVASIFIIIFGTTWLLLTSPPTDSIAPVIIHIVPGESLAKVAGIVKEKNVVRYSSVLRMFVTFFKSDKQIAHGDYMFKPKSPVYIVAWQLAMGHHNVLPLRITLKEGITDEQMADVLSAKLLDFNKNEFLADSRVKEGYNFPDTYFFFPLTTNQEVISELTSNFNTRITPLRADIELSGRSESDTIIMASLVEKEAQGPGDASIIAGILWKRIALGMALQVDASPITYTKKGLPEKPIDNPGLASIEATLHPIASPYLFYLHDKNGMVHYATTFSQHKSNIARYLKT